MKTYLLFGWIVDPSGGFNDFQGDFDEFHDCMRKAKHLGLIYFHIICSKTWQKWQNGEWRKIK